MRHYTWSLSDEDFTEAVDVGLRRYERVLELGLIDHSHNDAGSDQEERHVHGACAEKAFSCLTNLPWDKSTEGKRPDVGAFFVRSCSKTYGCLLLQGEGPTKKARHTKEIDAPGMYVLGVGGPRVWTFVGWTVWPEAQVVAVWNRNKSKTAPCWWVDQRDLEPLEAIL